MWHIESQNEVFNLLKKDSAKASLFLQSRLRSITKLLQKYTHETYGEFAIHEAWNEFSSWIENRYRSTSYEDALFLPWFAFTWRPYKEVTRIDFEKLGVRTVAENFLISHTTSLSPEDLRLIQACISAPPCFYEVIETKPGSYLKILDLFTHEEIRVEDAWVSQRLHPGDVVLAMVSELEEDFSFFVGCSFKLNKETKERLSLFRNWASQRAPLEGKRKLRFSAEIFEIYFCCNPRLGKTH